MFSSQKCDVDLQAAFLMLSGAVGRSFSTAGSISAVAALFVVP